MDKQELEIINKFAKKVKKEFSPDKILLFGSKATGKDWKRSDYDFIIISKKFKDMHWLDRISKLVNLWDSLSDIDILPYTPEEFKEKKKTSSTVRSALKNSKSIAA